MDQKIKTKVDFKNRFITYYNNNKLKFIILFGVIIVAVVFIFLLRASNEKKNKLISDKYIIAGVYLASDQEDVAKNLYKEIILSKNKFYSILALNIILEKNLVSNENEILNYFEIIQQINTTKDQQDILIFKKALYLMKISKIETSNELLKKLINDNSNLKLLAQEIIDK